ncbi:MAG: stage III sporulation protein AB [Ruminococcus sp.]|nr:stage III sporulation protein AB [Ruminococcus sp.]
MFKLIMCFMVVISATLIGNSYSQRISNRVKCLNDVIEAISRMRALISFSGMNIQNVVIDSFKNTSLAKLFLSKEDEAEDFYVWWSSSLDCIEKSMGINKEDKELLLKFGRGLGKTDTEGQLEHLELYKELFIQRLNSAKDAQKEKGRLYRVLGFSLGCAVTLVLL